MLDAATLNTADQVDESIARYLAYVQSLKRLKNTRFVAVCRLPPEVLALIFEEIAFCEDKTGHSSLAHPCLYVAQVCTIWREIALGLQRIWGIVYTDSSKRWLDEIQRRSGSCPLFFRDGRREITHGSMSLLREQTHRVKIINLHADEVSPMGFVFGESFPILESLTVSRSDYSSYQYTGSAPCLRFLSIKDFTISVTHSCLPALQTLIISSTWDPEERLSMTLLPTLRHFPNLRYIKLEGPMAFKDPISKATDPIIELPHLEHLEARCIDCSFLRVLKRISAPQIKNMELKLDVIHHKGLVPDVDGIFSVLPSPFTSNWRVRSSIKFRSSFRDPFAQITFRISIYSSRDSDASPIVKAQIYLYVNAGESCQTAANLFSLLPAGQPDFVYFHSDCFKLTGTLFKPLVDSLACITELHFDCPSAVRSLLGGAKSTSSETLPAFPLPGLKRIYIIPKHALYAGDAAWMLKMLPPMRTILRNRKKVHPIEVVKLGEHMKLPDKDLTLLRQIVKVEMLNHDESMRAIGETEDID